MQVEQVAKSPYEYLGGNENVGSQGGYYNYRVAFPELWKTESVQTWLRKKQETTRAEYLTRFDKFLRWAAVNIDTSTPDGFLEWANSQRNGRAIQNLIEKYVDTLSSKSNGYIVTSLLRSFLDFNACEKPLPKIDWPTSLNFIEGYRREEIQKLLSYLPNPVHKLYVLIGKETGFRANDILFLRYRHIAKDYAANQKFVHIAFESERFQRRKSPGRTFLGPNSLELLRQLYSNGTLKQEPDAKLFNFSYRNIAKVLTHAKRAAGLEDSLQPSHGLRKFYENQLDRAGLDVDKKRQLEGHANGVRKAYTSREVEELRELYGEAYRYLDLSEESVVSNELGALQAKIDEQEKTITDLKNERADWAEALKFTKELMAHPKIRRLLNEKRKE